MTKDQAFLAANFAAREAAGLKNKPGRYEFICPNCGTLCVGDWIMFGGELHGGVGCPVCDIFLGV